MQWVAKALWLSAIDFSISSEWFKYVAERFFCALKKLGSISKAFFKELIAFLYLPNDPKRVPKLL